jgi:hypothetical protein
MSSVRFLSITPTPDVDLNGLGPAPSVRDWEEIKEGLDGVPEIDDDKILEGSHFIRGTYRGWNIYLYPNLWFERSWSGRGGNGLNGGTRVGDIEDVKVTMNGKMYRAQVEYA